MLELIVAIVIALVIFSFLKAIFRPLLVLVLLALGYAWFTGALDGGAQPETAVVSQPRH